jgi:tetratricopeptide (TPR) repeat protein
MKKQLFLLLSLLLNFWIVFSQKSTADIEDFQEGQYFFERSDFEDAVGFYLKLLEKDSLQANFNFKVGECYLNIPGKEFMAVKYLERASKKVVPKKDYDKNNFSERKAPLHAYFYLGNAYRMANKLDKALEMYNKFLDSPYFWGNYNQNVVEREIKSCERAKIIQDAPVQYIKVNPGENINTDFIETDPVISVDGKTLVFMRQLKFYNAIFYTIADGNGWKTPVNINPEILSDGEFYPTGLSSKGDQLLLIKKESEDNDIYISKLVDGKWSTAVELDDKINSLSDESFASFGPDDKIIYLSSNRNGGHGGYDLYVSNQLSDGSWGKPKNLGKTLNTESDEQNPVYCAANQSLFFCSNGHYNMGGYDIFYANLKDEKWGQPINIGYPINNTRDNLWFYPAGQGREGYCILSDPDGSSQGDFFYVKITSESVLNYEDKK